MLLSKIFNFLFSAFLVQNKFKHQDAKESSTSPTGANAFVTFHVKSEDIVKNIQGIQDKLVSIDSRFNTTLQSIKSLHVTIIIVKINEENKENANIALKDIAAMYKLFHSNMKINFKGISSFGNTSLHAEPDEESQTKLMDFYVLVKERFEAHGIASLSQYDFHPHMSISVLDKDEQKILSGKWDSLKSADFELGVEEVKSIQLCAMSLNQTTQDYNLIMAENLFE
uniref:A-kinase anchor protein 7-like phosphoesterase domain-containing protein n=1 Tax=Acrobeloides nanus TaxID=290746 RepID=A0A914CJ71_9BILA